MQGLEVARRRGDQTFVLAFRAALIVGGTSLVTGTRRCERPRQWRRRCGETEDNFDLFLDADVPGVDARRQGRAGGGEQSRRMAVGAADARANGVGLRPALVAAVVVDSELGRSRTRGRIAARSASTQTLRLRRVLPEPDTHCLEGRGQRARSCLLEEGAPLSPMREHVRTTCRGAARRGARRARGGGGRLRRRRRPLARLRRALRGGAGAARAGALPGGARQSARGSAASSRRRARSSRGSGRSRRWRRPTTCSLRRARREHCPPAVARLARSPVGAENSAGASVLRAARRRLWPRRPAPARRGAQGRHHAVLRPRRLHRPLREASDHED